MQTLKQLRDRIDKLDLSIIKKLSERKVLSKKIGKLKFKLKQKIIDNQREQKLINKHLKLCKKYDLSVLFIKKIFKIIILESRKIQNKF